MTALKGFWFYRFFLSSSFSALVACCSKAHSPQPSQAYLLHFQTQNIMADLQAELEKLLTAYDERSKYYDTYLDTSKKHNELILGLAEMQPIGIKDFEKAEAMYDDMLLSEKTYRIHKEVFERYREEVITKLTPVQNIKIKFTCNGDKNKGGTEYYVWLEYNRESPDESQLVLQKISDMDNEPKLM